MFLGVGWGYVKIYYFLNHILRKLPSRLLFEAIACELKKKSQLECYFIIVKVDSCSLSSYMEKTKEKNLTFWGIGQN